MLPATRSRGSARSNRARPESLCGASKSMPRGKSCKAIAAGLNNEGILGPRGGIWRQNTINGNRARGTGILNNQLYVGWLVWNRLEYKTKVVSLGKIGRAACRERVCQYE